MKPLKIGVFLILALLGLTPLVPAQQSDDFGNLEGQVRFTGNIPPPKRILTTDGGTLLHSDLVVDPKSKGLRHVAVILEDVPAQSKVSKGETVLVDQRDMVFLPRVVAIRSGQKVRFENNDLCNHSVMASSTVAANQFNVVAAPNQPHEHVFEPQKHPIPIGCALHPWMRAWVYVVPHPWFAISDAQGKFRIDRVPPGKYSVWLRHADGGIQERQQVRIDAGKTAVLTMDWPNTKNGQAGAK